MVISTLVVCLSNGEDPDGSIGYGFVEIILVRWRCFLLLLSFDADVTSGSFECGGYLFDEIGPGLLCVITVIHPCISSFILCRLCMCL